MDFQFSMFRAFRKMVYELSTKRICNSESSKLSYKYSRIVTSIDSMYLCGWSSFLLGFGCVCVGGCGGGGGVLRALFEATSDPKYDMYTNLLLLHFM